MPYALLTSLMLTVTTVVTEHDENKSRNAQLARRQPGPLPDKQKLELL